jgi:hypothetical protein
MVHCVVAASFLRNMHIAIESIASNNICSTWREEGDNVAGGLKMHNLLTQVGILEVRKISDSFHHVIGGDGGRWRYLSG